MSIPSKKICFTVTNDLTTDQRMQKICTSLSNAGYRVTLIGRELPESMLLTTQPYAQKRIRCLFRKGKLFYLEYNIRLLWHLMFRERPDIFGAIDLDTILPHLIASRIRKRPLSYDAHEYFTELPELVNRPGSKAVWKWIERISIPHTTIRYTCTKTIAELFHKEYGLEFGLVRNIPVLRPEIHIIPQAEKFILYQGALNDGRGIEQLIRAMPEIPAPIRLKIAGEGDLSDQLRGLVLELNLSERVEFLGYIRPDALRMLTAQSWIGYNLLENKGLSYYYSLSNKFFDYIHALVPSLSPDFPEYKSINATYEVCVLSDLTIGDIVSSIRKLYHDEAFYMLLRDNCRIARQACQWAAEEKRLIALYDQNAR